MKVHKFSASVCAALALTASTFATLVPAGTDVLLAFKDPLSSKTAKAGDHVNLQVVNNVVVNGKVILAAGTNVTGVIENVSKRGSFGKNGSIRLTLNPANGIPLEPRTKGKNFKGSRTDKAAIASGAGLVVLGPIGLVGGIFVKGKSVEIHPGDKLDTDVSRDVNVP